MYKKIINSWALLIPVLGTVCILIAGLAWLSEINKYIPGFNSDHFYTDNFLNDLFQGAGVSGWILPGANFFFPDMLIYSFGRSFSSDFGYRMTIYSMTYFVGLIAAFFFFYLSIGLSRSRSYVASALSIFGVSFFLKFGGLWIILPNWHGGAVLASMFACSVCFSGLSKGWSVKYVVTFFVLTSLAAISDLIFLAQFIAPVMLFSGIWFLMDRSKKTEVLFCWAICCAAVVSRFIGVHLISELGMFIQKSPEMNFSFESLFYSFQFLWERPMILLLVALFFLATVVGVVTVKDRYTKLGIILVACIFLGTVSAPIVVNLFRNKHEIRYILPVFVVPLVTFSLVAMEFFRSYPASRIFLISVLVLLGLITTFDRGQRITKWSFQTPYPKDVRCLDEIMSTHGIEYAYSDYWNSRRSTMLSRKGIKVLQLAAGLKPYFLAINSNVFNGAPPVQASRTVLLPAELNVDSSKLKPHKVYQCGGRVQAVLVYGDS